MKSNSVITFSCEFSNCIKTEIAPKLLLCGSCKSIAYCSKDCQKTDWRNHKRICLKLKNDRENLKSLDTMKNSPPLTRDNNISNINNSEIFHHANNYSQTEENKLNDLNTVNSWTLHSRPCVVTETIVHPIGIPAVGATTSGRNRISDDNIHYLNSVQIIDKNKCPEVIPQGHLKIYFNGRGIRATFFMEDMGRMLDTYKEVVLLKINSGISIASQITQYRRELEQLDFKIQLVSKGSDHENIARKAWGSKFDENLTIWCMNVIILIKLKFMKNDYQNGYSTLYYRRDGSIISLF